MQLLHSKRPLTILKEPATTLSRNSPDSSNDTLLHGDPVASTPSILTPSSNPCPNPPSSRNPCSTTNESDPETQTVQIVRNFYNNLYHSAFGPPTLPSEEIHLQIHINEIRAALMTCKPRSAPGCDRISSPPHPLRNSCITTCSVFQRHHENENGATWICFCQYDLTLIGDPTNVTNYIPISLLSTLYKVLTKVLICRLRNTIEERSIIPPEQAGFRKNFSTVDHIHALSTVAEKCHEFNIQLCAAFIDFKKAFDSVELSMLLQALESFSVDPNMIKAVQLLYANGMQPSK
ncbi:hypothetical protein ANCDUO_08266 [Ancylostoma duodenale]|uniref:Reverse transcriptase domain-containing protein n=1 Tax=Ancylostoma duodenale TaxID=51022 RepID=A0A0C2GWH6_9BILA|nr:hypothetical protein ANCDUO_08266 [Ancylostoma duodenale]